MADRLGTWIAKSIIQHDKKYSADLNRVETVPRYCQLLKFHTFRTEEDPKQEIYATIGDRTHRITVSFDTAETDRFERPVHGSRPDFLTSHLRSIFLLKSYKYKVVDPSLVDNTYRHQGRELPQLQLEVRKWEVVGGSRKDPFHFDNTVEIGHGRSDGKVQKILNKWWYGESNSNQSKVVGNLSQMSAIRKSTSLQDVLQSCNYGKKKPIPEWLFKVSEEQKRALEQVTFFGLDTTDLEDKPSASSSQREPTDATQASDKTRKQVGRSIRDNVESSGITTNAASSSKVKLDDHTQNITVIASGISLPQPGQKYQITQSQDETLSWSQPELGDDSENDEIPVKQFNISKHGREKRTRIVDPLAFDGPPSPVLRPSHSPDWPEESPRASPEESARDNQRAQASRGRLLSRSVQTSPNANETLHGSHLNSPRTDQHHDSPPSLPTQPTTHSSEKEQTSQRIDRSWPNLVESDNSRTKTSQSQSQSQSLSNGGSHPQAQAQAQAHPHPPLAPAQAEHLGSAGSDERENSPHPGTNDDEMQVDDIVTDVEMEVNGDTSAEVHADDESSPPPANASNVNHRNNSPVKEHRIAERSPYKGKERAHSSISPGTPIRSFGKPLSNSEPPEVNHVDGSPSADHDFPAPIPSPPPARHRPAHELFIKRERIQRSFTPTLTTPSPHKRGRPTTTDELRESSPIKKVKVNPQSTQDEPHEESTQDRKGSVPAPISPELSLGDEIDEAPADDFLPDLDVDDLLPEELRDIPSSKSKLGGFKPNLQVEDWYSVSKVEELYNRAIAARERANAKRRV